ncbi:hypothetical protein QN277_007485 [Acacia crassicarpa]|uniref:Cupin type-1 domain-containing protein n=1 Tax=Acacia crassicarpa TaxID=499986 RepID=A0AAE1MA11_9FABA|nr:hypothetical protein QN277_007485 [Acacia crassicarpa]
MKARFAFLVFMCSVFLAVASVGLAGENSKLRVCVRRCAFQNDNSYLACHARCKLPAANRDEEKEEAAEKDPRLPDPHHPREPKRGEEEGSEEEEKPQWQREKEEERRHKKEQEKEEEEEKEREEEKEKEREEEREEEKEKEHQENPYYLPSNKFQTRFENEYGRIKVLQKFDVLSPHLQMLKYYRIVEYKARPGTLIAPHHSDAEYLIIATKGRALVTLLLPNYKESFNLERFDVLRVPAGAICYTINRANNEDLVLYKLALPVNIPGQFENFYPSGNQIPYSYLKAFEKKTIQAAYKAPYEEIEEVLWGSSEEQGQGSEEGVILKLKREQLISLISRAQIRLAKGGKESPLGPFNLKSDVQARYSNNHGTFREAHPHRYEPLSDLAIGVSHLKLHQGSMFMPHYNTRGIILAIIADGDGNTEIACPHLVDKEEGEQQEGQIKSLSANVTKGDLYIIPAGHPVSVRASEKSILEVVEFVLNAPYNFRNFLAGKKDNVLNEIDREVYDAVFEGSGKQVERLLNRQTESFFVDREKPQPSGGGRGGMSPRQIRNRVAWSSFFTTALV